MPTIILCVLHQRHIGRTATGPHTSADRSRPYKSGPDRTGTLNQQPKRKTTMIVGNGNDLPILVDIVSVFFAVFDTGGTATHGG